MFKEYAKKKNIALNHTIAANLFIKADPLSLNRIVINLIENAIKFSSNDCEIEISLRHDNKKINCIFNEVNYNAI